MSVRFEAELADLKGRGVEPKDILPSEFERLVRACDRCDKPFSQVNAELVGMPIFVCEGVYFWKMTVGASVWLDQYAKRWWLDTGQHKAYFWAIVYSLMHSRDKGAFTELTDEEEAYGRIRSDALRLVAHEDEIVVAVDLALHLSDREPPAQKAQTLQIENDWQGVVARLESQSGIPAEKWIWERSLDYTRKAYRDLTRFAAACGGKKAERMKDELDYAMNALARLRAEIVGRVTALREKERKEASGDGE